MNDELERLPYWEKLSNEEKELVTGNSSMRTCLKGTFLKGHGESCLGMIFVLSGSVRTLMISEEGREVTLFTLSSGDSCILSASCVLSQISFETQMVATEDTKILIVNSGAYARLMDMNIEVKCFSLALAAERASHIICVLQQIVFSRFEQRLARYLLLECERIHSDEIVMTKEAIAREVNTAREVVSRTLKQFADKGLIEMRQKTIRVIDQTGLRRLL